MARPREERNSVGDYRHASDMRALHDLAKFEIRRVRSGDFAIFVRGTSLRVGTVYNPATALSRALYNVMEAGAHPSRDRAAQKRAHKARIAKRTTPSGDVDATSR